MSFTSYCGHCGSTWTNTTPNCPHCGAPDHSAKKTGGNETTMNNDDNDDTEFSFREAAMDGMKLGAAMAAASEANNLIKAGMTMAALQAGLPIRALESAVFQKGMPVLASLTMLYIAETYPDLIPKSEFVAKAAKMALAEASAESIRPMIGALTPTLMALAASGERAAIAESKPKKEEEEEASSTEAAYGDDDVIEIIPA